MKNSSALDGLRVIIPIMEMKEGFEESNSIPMRLSIGRSVVCLIRDMRDLMMAILHCMIWNERDTIHWCSEVESLYHRDRVVN